jgi:RNA polymerase sigma-70 factor (ECF subfamily)
MTSTDPLARHDRAPPARHAPAVLMEMHPAGAALRTLSMGRPRQGAAAGRPIGRAEPVQGLREQHGNLALAHRPACGTPTDGVGVIERHDRTPVRAGPWPRAEADGPAEDAPLPLPGGLDGLAPGDAEAPEPSPDAEDDITLPHGAGAARTDDTLLTTWLEAVADHDERALAALYEATFPRVYGLVLRITRRTALAEEATEDTYWQVWRQAPRFDATRGRALSWLLAMARSRAIDALRRDERFRHDELPEDDAGDALAHDDTAPPDLLEATRTGSALHAALARLEAQPRQLVALAFLRGLTHDEIAAQCALPLGTVKSQIRRALITLRACLVEAGLAAGEMP